MRTLYPSGMTEETHEKIANRQRKNAHAVRELHESTTGSGGRASLSPPR